jgi:hypothetical protein
MRGTGAASTGGRASGRCPYGLLFLTLDRAPAGRCLIRCQKIQIVIELTRIERTLAIDPPASDMTIAPHRMGDFVQQDLPQASSQLRLRATEKLPPVTMGLE